MNLSLNDFIANLPHFWLIKDTKLTYIQANNHFLNHLQLNDVKNLTDFDMPWAATHANKYRQDDQLVLLGQPKLNYQETQLGKDKRLVTVLVNKTPLVAKGKIVGLTCYYRELFPARPRAKLSVQQFRCLTQLTQGQTAKEIAKRLNLSVRTVQSYTEILKNKLNCKNKTELIQRALHDYPEILIK